MANERAREYHGDKDADDSGCIADALMSLALQGELRRVESRATNSSKRCADIRGALDTLTGFMLRDVAARAKVAR